MQTICQNIKLPHRNFALRLGAFLFFCFGIISAQTPTTKNADGSPMLKLNETIERQIKGGETQTFQCNVKAGFYARAEVEQKNIDVVVSLFDSNGKLVIEMDGKDGRLWREAISVIAELKGIYRVEIKAYGTAEMAGSYTLKLAERRKSVAKDRKRLEAETRLSAGRKFYEQGTVKFQDAVKEFEAAIAVWRELGENEWEAVTLLNLGWAYSGLSKNELAIEVQTRATELFQKTKDRIGEGKAVNGLGNVYNIMRQYEKAKVYYEQAVIIRREIRDRSGEGGSLLNLGNIYNSLAQYEKAQNYYEQVLIINREVKDRRREALTLFSLGNVYQNIKKYDEALRYFEQSLTISQEIKDYRQQISSLTSLGSLYLYTLKNEKKGLEVFVIILALNRSAKDKKGESETLSVLGAYYSYRDTNKAVQNLKQSLAIRQELKDKKGEIFTLAMLGSCYRNLKQYGEALEYYEQAYLLAQEIKDWEQSSGRLQDIGHIYSELKNYEKAREYFERSLEESKKNVVITDTFSMHSNYTSLAFIYESLKKYEKALEYHEKALEYIPKIERGRDFLFYITYTQISHNYRIQKQYEKARQYLEKALTICRENKWESENITLLDFGTLYQEQKQYEKAGQYFEQALNLAAKDKSSIAMVKPLVALGQHYIELKQYEKARVYIEQSLLKYRESSSNDLNPENFQIYTTMSGLWDNLKNPQLAIFYGKQAVNFYQAIRDEIKTLDKDTQRNFVKDKEPTYRKLADLLISEGRLIEAQAVLDLLKEEEFKNVVRRSGETPAVVPYSQAEASVSASIENLAKLERERGDLLKQKEAGALSAEQQTRLDRIPVEVEAANKAFRLALDALGKAETGSANRVAEIQSEKSLQRALQTLDKETDSEAVALYTVLGNEQSVEGEQAKTKFGWVILVTPTSRKAYPIDVSDLEQTVFQFRDALSSVRYDPKPVAQKLYDKLFRQTSAKQKTTLETDLQTLFGGTSKNKTLMWSLDGILRYVPMAALHDGNNYLVEKYGSVIFTKESFLTLTEKNAPKWNALGLGVSEGRENFNPLPGAERELKDIVRLPQTTTGIMDGEIKLNKDFAEEATLKLWREGKFSVVHIASHYSFNATDPTSSFLLVGDGHLSFSEMQDKDNLFGALDLLTLSACDTATSGNGKEAEGFAYLAQSLGAKSVMASLWEISDAGTPELMTRFYDLRKKNPEIPKGEAFRQAQISLLGVQDAARKNSAASRSEVVNLNRQKINLPLFVKDAKKPFAHPHYWSSFVLIGNWR